MTLATLPPADSRTAPLKEQLKQFGLLYRAGRLQAAVSVAQSGSDQALRAGQRELAEKFLGDLGAARFALQHYQDALRAFQEARAMARADGASSILAKLELNIASLYIQIDQTDAAADAAEQAESHLPGPERFKQLPKLLILLGTLRAQQERIQESTALFRRAITAAERAGDWDACASGWNELGNVLYKHGRLAAAETALLEGYRIRKIRHLRTIESSYGDLGLLRLAAGDREAAAFLLDLAVERSREPGGHRPKWEIYAARGRLHLLENRVQDAISDLRVASRLAGIWRRSVPSTDAARVIAENAVQEVYASHVEAALAAYRATGDARFNEEAFQAAEQNRAVSMQAILREPRDWRKRLPDAYWETLHKLEAAGGEGSGEKPAALQAALVDWESRAGSGAAPEIANILPRLRASLSPDAAYLSFYLGVSHSYVWCVSRDAFEVHQIPAATEMASLTEQFRRALQRGDRGWESGGKALFHALFGQLGRRFQRKARWILALDEHLATLPLAALTVPSARKTVYVAERHAVQLTAGAGVLVVAAQEHGEPATGPFLGIADPIYNRADPRVTPETGAAALPWLARAEQADGGLRLARIPGSARETAAAAAAWGGTLAPILLTGQTATRNSLQTALKTQPAIVHFATHVVHSQQGSQSGLIVLSLNSHGQNDFLGPTEIATWRLNGALVSLSGCGSGLARALPATGLMGLTRALESAGAGAVVASLWPSPDDSGALFVSMYRHLREAPGAGPASALQQAQLDLLRSGTWRSLPRYWGAYFITGNSL